MSSHVLATACVLLLIFIVYKCWYRPVRLMRLYARMMADRGYRVHMRPYNPLSAQFIKTIVKGMQEGDALKAYKTEYLKYDAIVSNELFHARIQVLHPDFIRDYYNAEKHYEYPKDIRMTRIFCRVAPNGLIFAQGPTWKRKRTIFNKVFNFDFIKNSTLKIAQCCDEALDELQNERKVTNDNQVTYDILDFTVKSFSKVMLSIFLGGTNKQTIEGESAGNFIKQLMTDITSQAINPVNVILGPAYSKLGITRQQRDINRRIQVYINWGHQYVKRITKQIGNLSVQQLKQSTQSNIITSLLVAHAQDTEDKNIQSKEEIFEEFTIFFVAGTDTTSTFAQMMIYEILRHPEVEKKVREEIDQHMQNDDYSYDNLKKLAYIELIQKEVTRLHGPGTNLFFRRAAKDNYLNNIPIHKDTVLSLNFMTNHYNPQYFREPTRFIPERWQQQCNNLPPYVLGGFSAGTRTCIGKHLAMLESKIALVKFFKRYKSIQLGKQDYKMIFKFLYGPEDFQSTMLLSCGSK